MKLSSLEVLYPPVGMAHLTEQIEDLFSDRLEDAKGVRAACVMQPKAAPHFGTLVVVMASFATAERLGMRLGLDASVLIDLLDNAPGEAITEDGVEFTRCLTHTMTGGRPRSEVFSEPIVRLAKIVAGYSGLRFKVRHYREIQQQPAFRSGLREMLVRQKAFLPMMCPSGGALRIRPMCPECGLVDKEARRVRYDPERADLAYWCPSHGWLSAEFIDPAAMFDANAPIRTVLRSLCFIEDRRAAGIETIIVNGGDWAGVWMQRVYFDALHALGVGGTTVPLNLFVPQVLDPSGAKLSKTIYLAGGAYAGLSPCWLSAEAFEAEFGDAGLLALWNEVRSWLAEPRRLFRNYTVAYFEDVLSLVRRPARPAGGPSLGPRHPDTIQ